MVPQLSVRRGLRRDATRRALGLEGQGRTENGMAQIGIQQVVLDPRSLRETLAEIDAATQTNETLREHILALIELTGMAPTAPRRRGRPAGSGRGTRAGAAPRAARKSGGGTTRRGHPAGSSGGMTLRAAILKAIQSAGRPLKGIELRDQVLMTGYQTQASPNSLYTSIFSTAKKMPEVAKVDKAFTLSGGSGSASGSTASEEAATPTTKKKRGRPTGGAGRAKAPRSSKAAKSTKGTKRGKTTKKGV